MRALIRWLMVVLLLVLAVFAAWAWLRPYAWGVDESAGCRIIGCQVKQDRSNYWLDVHLEVADDRDLDLERPVVLVAGGGRRIEPADLTMLRRDDGRAKQAWVKFWLDGADFDGPVVLEVNGGGLSVRTRSGVPALGSDGLGYFTSNRW